MDIISVHAERGRIGKSLLSARIYDLYEDLSLPVSLIRIETRHAGPAQRPSDVTILVEDLIDTRDRPGGSTSAMAPLWAYLDDENAVSRPGAIIVDWLAGASELRREIEAASGLSALATELGIRGISVSVTTNDSSIMRQAAADLTWDRQALPEFARLLVLNEVAGPFAFVRGTDPHFAYLELMVAAEDARRISLPLIGADAWAPFRDARISMREALCEDANMLAPKIGLDRWVTRACRSHLAAWWTTTDEGLRRALRFPGAPDELADDKDDR